MADREKQFVERVAALAEAGHFSTSPILAMSRAFIEAKAAECLATAPGIDVYYALKANDDPTVARVVRDTGLGFEVGSIAELDEVLGLGVPPGRVISSNPVKSPEFIKLAWDRGVRMFAFDSRPEVDKLTALAPGCEAVLRLAVPNEGSDWPLSGKFGVEFGPSSDLLAYGREKGLNAVGVNFHVGSQCTNLKSWDTAIGLAAMLFEAARKLGCSFDLLNLGGGYPSRYLKPVPAPSDIAAAINKSVARWFPSGVRLMLEPGRFVVGEAGIFVTRCIGKAERQDGLWVFLDVGIFNGLAEALGGIRYPYVTLRQGTPARCIITGPSCDGFDVVDREAELVEPEVGDIVLIRTAGAYTTVYAARFNGFPLPLVEMLE